MASKARKRGKAHRVVADDPTKLFRRGVHSVGDLRHGTSNSRATVHWSDLPRVVAELAKTPIYLHAFAPLQFPALLGDLRYSKRLQRQDIDTELSWAASVMSLFAKPLSAFAELRHAFFDNLLNSELAEAKNILDRIQKDFGFSVWLIKNRLLLLQLAEGTLAQKSYLEEVLALEDIPGAVFIVCYYTSIRLEENVTLAGFDSDTEEVARLQAFGPFMISQIRAHDLHQMADAALPIAWAEPLPLVDRFEATIMMCQLRLASSGAKATPSLALVNTQLSEINDSRLRMIRWLSEGATPNEKQLQPCFDNYAIGRYDLVVGDEAAPLELRARAAAISNFVPDRKSVKWQIIDDMRHVLLCDDDYAAAQERLQKMALILSGWATSYEILAFIRAKPLQASARASGILTRLAMVFSAELNPWHVPDVSWIAGNSSLSDQLIDLYPDSPSLQIETSLARRTLGISPKNVDLIPAHRLAKYEGQIALLNADTTTAINRYKEAIATSPVGAQLEILVLLSEAYLISGETAAAVAIITDSVVAQPEARSRFPIAEVLGQSNILRESSIRLCNLLYFGVRYIHNDWSFDLSDAFENTISQLEIKKPSELRTLDNLAVDPQLIFFLKNVCVPRTLDDTSRFENMEEIEQERIKICQWLAEIDPNGVAEYANEIRTITRTARVANLLKQIESGKIYVDEVGVSSVLDESLRTAFQRYLDSPASASRTYHADKITQHLGEILGDKAPPGLKSMRVPTSEADAMLLGILTDYMQEFAVHPAFGLDTHLSTSIRHGAFEGHARSPLSKQGLLPEFSKKSGEYTLPPVWESRLPDASQLDLQHLRRILGRFADRIDDLIQEYVKEKLQFRGADFNQQGLFNFALSQKERDDYLERAKQVQSYDELLPIISDVSWSKTTQSLETVRREISELFADRVNKQLTTLFEQVEANWPHDMIHPLGDAIALARTDFQNAVLGILGWFQRPTEMQRDAYEFELAVDVAVKQLENCYIQSPVKPRLKIESTPKFVGGTFDPLVEILFLLLQNVIRHSGAQGTIDDVELTLSRSGGFFQVSVNNRIDPTIDLDERRAAGNLAVARYTQDTAMKMARRDVGSGLSKVWRIATYSLRRNHSLQIEVTDEHRFITSIRFNDDEIIS